jgi:hypothetical protein
MLAFEKPTICKANTKTKTSSSYQRISVHRAAFLRRKSRVCRDDNTRSRLAGRPSHSSGYFGCSVATRKLAQIYPGMGRTRGAGANGRSPSSASPSSRRG